jgi:hypothetical protein
LLDRFQDRELEIRRLLGRDEDFRSACRDFDLAVKALKHWECVEHSAARMAEYRQIVDEIEAEIAALLDAALAPITKR